MNREYLETKIEAAQHQARLFQKELSRIKERIQFASPVGVNSLIKFLQSSSTSVDAFLGRSIESVQADPDPETAIQRRCLLTNVLCSSLDYFQHADIESVPPQIVQPIRRLIQNIFPEAEIIMVSSGKLNYSVRDLVQLYQKMADDLEEILGERVLTFPPGLPSHLFLISIPRTNRKHVLVHSILAHEIGHPVYRSFDIGSNIPIEIDESFREYIVGRLGTAQLDQTATENREYVGLDELSNRARVFALVTKVIENWKKELVSDAIGAFLFGPALLFATVYLSSAVSLLDTCSQTHPPFRLRLRLILRIIEKQFSVQSINPDLARIIAYWKSQSVADIESNDSIFMGAIASVQKEEILLKMIDKTESVLKTISPDIIYGNDGYKNDVKIMSEYIISGIVPVEQLLGSSPLRFKPTNVVSILNAGWNVYLAKSKEFTLLLPMSYRTDKTTVFEKLNEVLSKAIELHEIKLRAWEKE